MTERNQGKYLKTSDGRYWVCIEDAIEIYEDYYSDYPGADELVRYFKAVLANAQEHSP